MKRTLFIIIGVLIILILVGVWVYFLFFGTPNPNGGVFTNFDFGNTEDPTVVIEPDPEPTEPVVDVASPERLRQLTTKPVAGFAETQLNASSSPEVRYIEAGTGHVFSIDLQSGEEKRVSATTIPLANKGVITPNGQYMMIQSGTGPQADMVIGILSTTSDELRNFAVPLQITSFTATVENEILYSTPVGNQLLVRAYDPSDNTQRDLFTIPFRDATISWNASTAGPHIVYPHATSRLEGYVYTYTNGVAAREAASGYGLSAVGSSDSVMYSAQINSEYRTFIQSTGALGANEAPLTVVPEKCTYTISDPTIAVCGITLTTYSYLMPDTWYRGQKQMNDDLWEIDTSTLSAELLVAPELVAGRQVDVVNPIFGSTSDNFYFQNKRDQTLWMYQYKLATNLNE